MVRRTSKFAARSNSLQAELDVGVERVLEGATCLEEQEGPPVQRAGHALSDSPVESRGRPWDGRRTADVPCLATRVKFIRSPEVELRPGELS